MPRRRISFTASESLDDALGLFVEAADARDRSELARRAAREYVRRELPRLRIDVLRRKAIYEETFALRPWEVEGAVEDPAFEDVVGRSGVRPDAPARLAAFDDLVARIERAMEGLDRRAMD